MSKILFIKGKFKNSSDAKTVFANFSYLSLLQIAGYVFPLITLPYLARVIGTEGFGKIAFASAIVVWFQTISDWGFNLVATRNVAQNRDDKEKVSHIFSNVLWARCLLTIISGILLSLTIAVVPYFRENAAVILITFLVVPGYILFPDWFFQAIEKMKYTTIFNLFFKFLFTVAVFFFIREKKDYLIQPLLTAIGHFICGIGALLLIRKKWGYTIYKPNVKEIFKAIKESTDVFINRVSSFVFQFYIAFLSVLVRSVTQFTDKCSVLQASTSFSLTLVKRSLKLNVLVTIWFVIFGYNGIIRAKEVTPYSLFGDFLLL